MLEFRGYIEEIENFIFREECSIQIPKSIREKAFSYRLDVEITSIAGESYRNFKSIPAHSFYGYAVLVMRDHCEIKIPIEQARQTIYFEKIVEAYVNWYNLCFWLNQREYSAGIANVLGQIGNSLGLGTPVITVPPCPVWSGFEEIQLREVYVKCPFGTQFRLESSYWSPVIQNGDTDCSYDGKSKQNDGDKDDGLPPATAPQLARNPDEPYEGFPPPTSPEGLGDFRNIKDEESLNSPNPDNEQRPEDALATKDKAGWYMETNINYWDSAKIVEVVVKTPAPFGSTIDVRDLFPNNTIQGMGQTLYRTDVFIVNPSRGFSVQIGNNAYRRLPITGILKWGKL